MKIFRTVLSLFVLVLGVGYGFSQIDLVASVRPIKPRLPADQDGPRAMEPLDPDNITLSLSLTPNRKVVTGEPFEAVVMLRNDSDKDVQVPKYLFVALVFVYTTSDSTRPLGFGIGGGPPAGGTAGDESLTLNPGQIYTIIARGHLRTGNEIVAPMSDGILRASFNDQRLTRPLSKGDSKLYSTPVPLKVRPPEGRDVKPHRSIVAPYGFVEDYPKQKALLDKYPDSVYGMHAAYYRALSLYNSGMSKGSGSTYINKRQMKEETIPLLRGVQESYPDLPFQSHIKFLLADSYKAIDQFDKSIEAAKKVVLEHPNTIYSWKASNILAEALIKKKEYAEAQNWLAKAVASNEITVIARAKELFETIPEKFQSDETRAVPGLPLNENGGSAGTGTAKPIINNRATPQPSPPIAATAPFEEHTGLGPMWIAAIAACLVAVGGAIYLSRRKRAA